MRGDLEEESCTKQVLIGSKLEGMIRRGSAFPRLVNAFPGALPGPQGAAAVRAPGRPTGEGCGANTGQRRPLQAPPYGSHLPLSLSGDLGAQEHE